MGSFAILMYDLPSDNLHQMKDQDQAVIREQLTTNPENLPKKQSDLGGEYQSSQHHTQSSSFEQVDSIRFLKTNVSFYERAVLVWLKFKMLNEARLQSVPKTAQYGILQEFTHFLKGFLQKSEGSWSHSKNDFMLG